MTGTNRASETRAEETREATSRKRHWKPPTRLAAPDPRPGYVQKWVLKSLLGQNQPHTFSRRLGEGWQPRPVSTIPASFKPMGNDEGYIEEQGLILCEMPEYMVAERNAYYRGIKREQDEAVDDNLLRVQVPGHPIKKESETRLTKGNPSVRNIRIQEDEDPASDA